MLDFINIIKTVNLEMYSKIVDRERNNSDLFFVKGVERHIILRNKSSYLFFTTYDKKIT